MYDARKAKGSKDQPISNLTPAAVVISATFKDAPEDIQDAVKTILTHPWVEA